MTEDDPTTMEEFIEKYGQEAFDRLNAMTKDELEQEIARRVDSMIKALDRAIAIAERWKKHNDQL